MHTYNHWITDIEQPTTAKAFTYTIWFPELGQRYIGYKTINRGKDWLTYKSSSHPVNKLLSNGHTAVYRIIKWFDNATDARAEEIAAMTAYDVTKRLEFLNQSIGGVKFSRAGSTLSDDSRAKIGAARKGKTMSAESRAKIRSANKGKTRSDETRAKMSAALKGRVFSDETRAKISAASRNRSAEYRAKIGAANQIGLYVTPLGTFNTLTEASIAHNCSIPTIGNRCKSTSPTFKDWSFIHNP